MATFNDFMRIAQLTVHDKTSGKRMAEILSILRRNQVMKGLTPEKAVTILEELGPTYVKIGQLASNRSDLLPQAYCNAFEQLQDHVTPMPYQTVLDCIDKAYGHSWKEVFSSIEEKPLGAASIAQVHKAYLLDGTPVAVKVRRPGIVEQMSEDITLMKHMLALAEFSTSSHESVLLNLDNFVAELERTTANEVDFTVELNNLVRFRKEIADQEGVSSPIAYPAYSTDAVLVMEFIEGVEISDTEAIEKEGLSIDKLAERLAQSYVTQVLDDGFFHADPHPGNIIVRDGVIVWIDLGMTGSLTTGERTLVRRVFNAVAKQDTYDLMQAAFGLTTPHGEVNQGLLLSQLGTLLDRYVTEDLADINIGTVLEEIIEILRTQNLIMVPSVTMLARGFVTMEGVLARISPRTNVLAIVSTHVRKDTLSLHHIVAKMEEMAAESTGAVESLVKLPSQLSNTLEMIDRGQVAIKGEVKLPDEALATVYVAAGRLAMACISAGLFLGSSILCTTNMQPQILEVPVLGVLGYLGAFGLGVYVIWRTLMTRHHLVNHEKLE